MKKFLLPNLLLFCMFLCSIAAHAAIPVITTDPRDTSACSGTSVWFIVANTGTLPVTVSWQVSEDGTLWSPLRDTLHYTGTATDTLVVATDMLISGNMYRAIATNTDGSDTSLAAMLTVNPLPVAGTISGMAARCIGTSDTLTASVTGGTWSNTTTSVATVNAVGGVFAVSAGNDTVRYTVTNSCGTAVARFPIRVDGVASALPISGPSATCVGRSIALTNANVLGTWVWSSAHGRVSLSTSGLATGVTGGRDTVFYQFTNSCNTVTSEFPVNVDTVLATGTISGPTSVCRSSWISLSSSITGGMWFSGSSAVAVVDGAGNVTGVTNGTSIISYYRTNACGASMATHLVTVHRTASGVTGGDSVGIGATIALSDSATGGTWSSSDEAVATIDAATGVATGVAPGTTTITYTVTNSCGTTTARMTLHVDVPPSAGAIAGSDTVCNGTSITLTNAVTGGVWMSANDTIATIDPVSGVVTGVAKGLATISYTVTNAFGSSTISRAIYVNTPPVVTLTGPVAIAIGGNYFFRATPALGLYTHSNPGMSSFVAYSFELVGGLPVASIGSYVVFDFGKDTIFYTATNSCGSTTERWIVELTGASGVITNGTASSMSVYPNPAASSITVNVPATTAEMVKVTITNVAGQVVKELSIVANKATEITLDQPNGVYQLTAATTTGTQTAKIVVSK